MNKKSNIRFKKIVCSLLVAAMMTTSVAPVYAQTAALSNGAIVQADTQSALPEGYRYVDFSEFEPTAGGDSNDALLGFGTQSSDGDKAILSTENNNTVAGVQAMAIMPASNGRFHIAKTYEEAVSNAIISFDFYYDGVANRTMALDLTGGNLTGVHTEMINFGVNAGGYLCRAHGSGTTNIQKNFNPVKIGWNHFELDLTQVGKAIFKINGEEKLVVENETHKDEFASFKKVGFVNFWADAGTDPIYIDNYQIIQKVPAPTNMVVDDVNDTIDFTYAPGKNSPSDYEYTVDGGETWTECSKKPIYVGNTNIKKELIKVRAKAPAGSEETFPEIASDKDFTYNVNINLSMEREEDIENFGITTNTPPVGTVDPATVTPELTISNLYSHSGLTSLKLVPDSVNNAPDNSTARQKTGLYRIGNEFDETLKEKVLTVWMYDDLSITNTDHKSIILTKEFTEGGSPNVNADILNQCMFGFNNGVSKTNYVVRSTPTTSTSWTKWGTTSVQRSTGWHKFQFDYTSGYKCELYIDDVFVRSFDSEGMDAYYIQDTWTHSGTTITPYYIDDITITDTKELPVLPAAPTNPVNDDTDGAKTFGFTTAEGYDDLALYEYSLDFGKTFTTVTENPIKLENTGYDVGEVIVRVKATDDVQAGIVLRNAKAFQKPDQIYRDSLSKKYTFAKAFYKNDYTAKSWTSSKIEKALEDAKTSLDTEVGYKIAEEALTVAMDSLVLELDDQVAYGFEGEVEDKVIPFYIDQGSLDWGEYTNISALGDQAFKLLSENGKAQIYYNFAEPIDDKYLSFVFRDTKAGSTHIKLIDSETNNGIHIYGNSSSYYMQPITNGVYGSASNTYMRRNGDWYEMQFNLTGDGIIGTMDSRAWLNSNIIDKFDIIDIRFDGNEFLTIDDFKITEKNPITEIVKKDDKITLGYYDTYEFNINNLVYKTEKPYKTTDTIKYTCSDTSILNVTASGSIEPLKAGTATVTATASSGATATIEVEATDIRVESIKLSDSDYNDEPNYITELAMQPGYKKVINAILAPKGVTEREVSWTSSNADVAKVVDGEIEALKAGTTTITATSKDGGFTATLALTVADEVVNYDNQIFVAKDGDDMTGDGSIEKPYATIERARDEIRTMSTLIEGGVVVYLREGTYTILKGFEFDAQDSGIANDIKYMAYNDEEVVLSGAITIKSNEMSKVTDEETLIKLPDASKDKVYVYDLSDKINTHKQLQYVGHSMTNFMKVEIEDRFNLTNPYYSLSFDGDAQTLSRWPNVGQSVSGCSYSGYTRINSIKNAGAGPRWWLDDIIGRPDWIPPEDRDVTDTFELASNALTSRMATWNGIPRDGTNLLDQEIWMSGYWYTDFSDQSVQVRYITDGYLKADLPSAYGTRSSQGYNRFYVYNLIQELDVPGEWYFDQNDFKLYVYPPQGTDMNGDHEIQMAALEGDLFTFNETSNITVSGIDMQSILGHAVTIAGSDNIKVENSTIKTSELNVANIEDSENGIYSTNSGFENVNFFDINGGVSFTGGDEMGLVSQNNYLRNCHFKNFATFNKSYNPAINLYGIGNTVSSCMIEDGPHNAIMYGGNDHVIEFTEITDVVNEAKDQSAIYTGRNVLQRGSVVRNCYIHDIPAGTGNPNSAIYLDDLTAGLDIIDNKFENMGWGLFINGGRDNFIVGNEFINCGRGLILNDWGYTGVNNWNIHGYGTLTSPLDSRPTIVPWDDPDSAYGKYDHLWSIRDDDPYQGKYNVFIDNVKTGSGNMYYYMSRSVQANYTNVLKDWYFQKGNIGE